LTIRQINKVTRGGSDIAWPKKKRKPSRASAVKAADDAFSPYIRKRDPFCVTCGEATRDCSHVFSRSHYATRWNEQNAFGQCGKCHFIHHNQSESYLHDHVRQVLGEKGFEDLRDLWEQETHWKTYQIEEIARFYREKLKKLLAMREGCDTI
jgi:5-methylcytosine-specific restriction endonuclease McrA